jgi:hypothetical protein
MRFHFNFYSSESYSAVIESNELNKEKAREEAENTIRLMIIDDGRIIPDNLIIWCEEIYDALIDEPRCTECLQDDENCYCGEQEEDNN